MNTDECDYRGEESPQSDNYRTRHRDDGRTPKSTRTVYGISLEGRSLRIHKTVLYSWAVRTSLRFHDQTLRTESWIRFSSIRVNRDKYSYQVSLRELPPSRYALSESIHRHGNRTRTDISYDSFTGRYMKREKESSKNFSLFFRLHWGWTLLYWTASNSSQCRSPYSCDSWDGSRIRNMKSRYRWYWSGFWYRMVSLWESEDGHRSEGKTRKKRVRTSVQWGVLGLH